jgi:hypothetical protein
MTHKHTGWSPGPRSTCGASIVGAIRVNQEVSRA